MTSLTLGFGYSGSRLFEALLREHDGGRDIVFHLHFVGGVEIGTQLVNAPGAIGIVAHAQVIAEQLLVFEFELVAGRAVDAIDGEVLAPVVAPLLLVVALDRDR